MNVVNIQKSEGVIDGLGLKGLTSYQLQKSLSWSNVARVVLSILSAVAGAVFLVAGIAMVSVGEGWVAISAGLGSLVSALMLLFLTFHWSYSIFLSCQHSLTKIRTQD